MSFVIDLILILNQGNTYYLYIFVTHSPLLVYHVPSQLIHMTITSKVIYKCDEVQDIMPYSNTYRIIDVIMNELQWCVIFSSFSE